MVQFLYKSCPFSLKFGETNLIPLNEAAGECEYIETVMKL